MNQDERFMQLALELARRGGRAVAPNPMVGAVIVKNGRIIGKGWHQQFGGPHAEVNAIRSVRRKSDLHGSTLYVTLEPCRHWGKTPPCVDLIQKVGIRRVVCGSRDPSQKKLRIFFVKGSIVKKCQELNKFFFTWVTKKRPYITVKIALSADGFVAREDGQPVHLTHRAQDRLVHQLRADHQAIMVGINTVIRDDPHLGVRFVKGQDPLRIVLDSQLRIPRKAKVLRDKNYFIATTQYYSFNPSCHSEEHSDEESHPLLKSFKGWLIGEIPRFARNDKRGARNDKRGARNDKKRPQNDYVWISPGKKQVNLSALFQELARRGISSVLAEPGPTLYRSLKKAGFIDELIILIGKKKLKKGLPFPF